MAKQILNLKRVLDLLDVEEIVLEQSAYGVVVKSERLHCQDIPETLLGFPIVKIGSLDGCLLFGISIGI